MKIEIDVKEFATLIDIIREQRKPIDNVQVLADEIIKELPEKLVSLNRRT